MLAARGIAASHETVRQWALKFGQEFANRIRRRLPQAGDKWHLDKVAIKIGGVQHWLWRAVILLAKSAGRLRSDQSGKVRTPGASRGVSEDPVNQAHKVHGGGRGDMLQVCLDLPEVAGSA